MASLSRQRCFNHAQREAAARCPECHHDYCRECITEHEDRVICATCLRKLVGGPDAAKPSRWRLVAGAVRVLVAVFVLWLMFYGLAGVLLRLPAAFHEQALWEADK